MRCFFCVMREEPVSEGKYALDPADLCPRHLEMSGIPAYERSHPDGVCTETCGCMTLDALIAVKLRRLVLLTHADGA